MLCKMYLVSPEYLKTIRAITVAPDSLLLKWLGKPWRKEINIAVNDDGLSSTQRKRKIRKNVNMINGLKHVPQRDVNMISGLKYVPNFTRRMSIERVR